MASVKYVRFLTNFATNYQGEASGLPGTGLQERGLPGAGGSAVWTRSVWPCVAGWVLGHWMLPTWRWYRKTMGVASDFGKPAQETEEGNQVLQAGWLGAGL